MILFCCTLCICLVENIVTLFASLSHYVTSGSDREINHVGDLGRESCENLKIPLFSLLLLAASSSTLSTPSLNQFKSTLAARHTSSHWCRPRVVLELLSEDQES